MVNPLKWRFTESMISDAPDQPGAYVLWRDGKPLAVGHALGGHDTIRSRLQAHASHQEGKLVTHYSWQISRDPLRCEAELAEALGLGPRPSPAAHEPPARRADAKDNTSQQPHE